MPGCLRDARIVSIFSIVHAAGSGSPVGHTLPRTSAVPSGLIVDAQLHAIPRVGVPLERHAHRHLVGGLPRDAARASGRCRRAPAVALVDEADVAALAARFACRARRLRWCSRSVRPDPSAPWRGGRRFRRAAAPAPCRRPRPCAGTLCRARRSTTAGGALPPRSRNRSVHGSGGITRTRAWPVDAADGRLDEAGRVPVAGATYDAVGADRAGQLIDRPRCGSRPFPRG